MHRLDRVPALSLADCAWLRRVFSLDPGIGRKVPSAHKDLFANYKADKRECLLSLDDNSKLVSNRLGDT